MRSATPLLIVTLLLPAAVGAQDEIVLRGNQAYQEGDFAAAIEAYEAVQEAGFTSAGLEYNLGNAYFKLGELGQAILHWERALVLDPGEADAQANLELARTLTTDAIEPLPVFWLFSVATWWVDLLPRSLLLVLVSLGWLGTTGGIVLRFLARGDTGHRMGTWISVVGVVVVVLLGANLVARELGIGRAERAVVMVDAVAVRSAPAQDDDLTLFEVHEGTSVRLDQTTGSWAEVVLDDGKVGWVPLSAMEII
jgi:tetratricopeptide (TPR) repeat protein